MGSFSRLFLEVKMKDTELRKKAVKVRKGALEAIYEAGSGHPGARFPRLIYLHIFILRR